MAEDKTQPPELEENTSENEQHDNQDEQCKQPEKPNPPKLPLKPTDIVEQALNNAELLLNHIAEQGLDVKDEHIEVITRAKQAFEAGEWNTQIEIQFWSVYKYLAKISYPVTVEAVIAAHEHRIKHPTWWHKLWKKTRRNTLTYKAVKFYTGFTIVTLIIIVILHITYSIGSIRLYKIQSIDQKMAAIEKQLDQLDMIAGTNAVNQNIEVQKEKLLNQLYEINFEKENAIKLLESWLKTIKKFTFSEKSYEQRLAELKKQAQSSNLPAPPSPDESVDVRIGIIQEAQNYILVLGLYILPMLYGLLGALTFVLMDLAQSTKKMLFTKESNIIHTLDITLGTIAGLAVGVFWNDIKHQQQIRLVNSLGPLIVAFLGGFMVEYVFKVLEKWLTLLLEKAVGKESKPHEK